MMYNKPDITLLGDAARVIESLIMKTLYPNEPFTRAPVAAYDLDE